MSQTNFAQYFQTLTCNKPFPWQEALYTRFISSKLSQTCNLPTGLGKTSVLAIWLIAYKTHPQIMPRRLVYVVNRRTVVDQTTREAVKLLENAGKIGIDDLAISTLRGQFVDNRQWSEDPSRPAIICGTVDMIGSRLLFSGYGCGFKSRPLHAGFLGQDVLLVHDEAHLEPAFQKLLTSIAVEQKRCREFVKFHVMELSATSRSSDDPFVLTPSDYDNDFVRQRLDAPKTLNLQPIDDKKQLSIKIAQLAKQRANEHPNTAIIIFAHKLNDVSEIADHLQKSNDIDHDTIELLTGTLRGLERDRMTDPRDPNASTVFARFFKAPASTEDQSWRIEPKPGTVFLICTSAGEVGVDISADHLISDLTPFDSMAQRLGRVNRYGLGNACVDVVYPEKKEVKSNEYESVCQKTLKLLKKLNGDASPMALSRLPAEDRVAAFTPEPKILPATDILFDAWAMTTIREKMPGRPPVEPYLHGIRIAYAMQKAIAKIPDLEKLFEHTAVVYDPAQQKKKVEPYYFDSHRGRNAMSRDIGFSPDSLNMKSAACPAIEFLCLIGLQRCRPMTTDQRRIFEYYTWHIPLPINAVAVAVNGQLSIPDSQGYRFENAFRTDQKKHKSFLPATPIGALS